MDRIDLHRRRSQIAVIDEHGELALSRRIIKRSGPIVDRAERRREECRAVDEAGGGESEGFELAEQALIENTSHSDQHTPARIMRDAGPSEESAASVYGEADNEHKAD